MSRVILIADDDQSIRTVLKHALNNESYDTKMTGSAVELMKWVDEGLGDVVLTDILMEDGNGLDILKHINETRPNLPVVIMSAQNTVLTAINASESGAFEYLPKPFDLNEMKKILEMALNKTPDVLSNNTLDFQNLPLIGRSRAMQEVYRIIGRLITSEYGVLITGESGTGKELVAKTLHDFGLRKGKAFVAVNMGAIPQDLIETELFGYEKGAFTGADNNKIGRFQQSSGGTLFLDEIGDMPLSAQTRLLRVLQEGEISPVGGTISQRVDIRVIAATHRKLENMVKEGTFREDLYYRLNVVPIKLPALRERSGDIPDLISAFFRKNGETPKNITTPAMTTLENYNWSGNVRELENLVRRISVLVSGSVVDKQIIDTLLGLSKSSDGDEVVADEIHGKGIAKSCEKHIRAYLNALDGVVGAGYLYKVVINEVERPLIELTLQKFNGNQIKTAFALGLNRNTLRKKINDLNIKIVKTVG